MIGKLGLDPFTKNQKWGYLWINSLINSLDQQSVIHFVLTVCLSGSLPKYIKIKALATCFELV